MLSPEKRLFWHICAFQCQGATNGNLVSGSESACISFQTLCARILHLSTISTAGKFACSLNLQNLCDGERCGSPGILCTYKQVRHTRCYTKRQRGKSAFWLGFGSYLAALFYFHCVWLAPGKEIQRKHLRNIVIQPQLCLPRKKKKKLPEASVPLVRLLGTLCSCLETNGAEKFQDALLQLHNLSLLQTYPQPAKRQPWSSSQSHWTSPGHFPPKAAVLQETRKLLGFSL